MASGPFGEVSALVRGGLLKEAAASLAALARSGAQPWEVYVWLGRIEERRGRWADAEALFRRALEANPSSGAAELELARVDERLGRLDEAAGRVRRALELGGPAYEGHLALARLAERSERPDEAEREFRLAAGLEPGAALPRFELARLAELGGDSKEAASLLKDAAARAAGELAALGRGRPGNGAAAGFLTLMENAAYREAFLARSLRTAKGREALIADLRRVLKACPDAAAGRALLAEAMTAAGRFDPAGRELAAAIKALPGDGGAEGTLVAACIRLVDAGRWGRGPHASALERVRLLSRSGPGTGAGEWYQLFSALVCAGRYRSAFELGESLLDAGQARGNLLLWPWWRKVARGAGESRFCAAELARLERAARGGGHPHWFAYCRAVLLGAMLRHDETMAEYPRVRRLDARRYAWMHQPFLLARLHAGDGDADGAIAIGGLILKAAPEHWWVRCRRAEAFLMKGDSARALAEFERARSGRDLAGRREALTWHGEILLWLGEYDKALELLDEAVSLGARTFVYGWRGAARLKLGDREGAIADLDRALELDGKDVEAYCWRGEANRLAGRFRQSLGDLDLFIRLSPPCLWGHFNRGLARFAMKDKAGMAADFSAAVRAPALGRQVAFIARSLGLDPAALRRGGWEPAAMARFMEAGLELARGVRRWEGYVQFVWTGPL